MKITIEKLRARIAAYGERAVSALKALAEIPSVAVRGKDESAPFGEDVARALECACEMAEAAGASRTVNCRYYAYADFGEIGENTPHIGIFSHLDVVPAG